MKSSQILIKRRRLRVLPQIVLLIGLLTSCYQTYHLSNGEKHRNFFPVKDVYIADHEELEKLKFDYTTFQNPDTTNSLVQFITPTDLVTISDSINQDLLVIFYYPNCTNIERELAIARFAEKNKIPFILISVIYSPERTKIWFDDSGLKNQNHYVIPSSSKRNNVVLSKKRDFIKSCCPECYDDMKDELIHVSVLRFSKERTNSTDPTGAYGKLEFYTDWIKQEFNIKE